MLLVLVLFIKNNPPKKKKKKKPEARKLLSNRSLVGKNTFSHLYLRDPDAWRGLRGLWGTTGNAKTNRHLKFAFEGTPGEGMRRPMDLIPQMYPQVLPPKVPPPPNT